METVAVDIDVASFKNKLQSRIFLGGNSFKTLVGQIMKEELESSISRSLASIDIINIAISNLDQGGQQSLKESIDYGGHDFWYLTATIDLKPGCVINEKNIQYPSILELLPITYFEGHRFTEFRHKSMKTRERHEVKLLHSRISKEIMEEIFGNVGKNCVCENALLASYKNDPGEWGWWQQFVCVICGKKYFCSCFKQAIEKFVPKAVALKSNYAPDGWPHKFLSANASAIYKDNICHLCTAKPSDLLFCLPMYGSTTKVRYGSYIEKFAIAEALSERDAENRVRDILGIPRLGEGWVSQTQLFNFVQILFPSHKVTREASPPWLQRQRFDIYVEELKLAIEYQGKQHYEPVEHFGGEPGFEATKERDQRKKKMCRENNVDLIYFKYDENITIENVEKKLSKYMMKKLASI